MYYPYSFDLTPVQQIDNILVKRDDLFEPFDDMPVCGGKLRQALCLFEENKEAIKAAGHVITTSSIHSPQGVILAKVCQSLGIKFTLFVGSTTSTPETLLLHNLIRHILNLNGEVDFGTPCNWDNALLKYAKTKFPEAFLVKFGINAEKTQSIINCNSFQTKNLPTEIENLIIPVGSGLTMAGILRGVVEEDINVKRIVGVQTSGKNCRKTIDEFAGCSVPYDLLITGFLGSYSDEKKESLGNLTLDPLYEAKAFEFVKREHPDLLTKDSVFWIVGSATRIKHEVIAHKNDYECSDKVLKLSK